MIRIVHFLNKKTDENSFLCASEENSFLLVISLQILYCHMDSVRFKGFSSWETY